MSHDEGPLAGGADSGDCLAGEAGGGETAKGCQGKGGRGESNLQG